ncbi:MAG: MFS transporter [Burkholderiales bacterium]
MSGSINILRKIPGTVIVLGFVSFFNDLASDMVIPLIPLLLVTELAAGPIALGLIEGLADAVASFVKLWSGRYSDRLGGRRKGLALTGYTVSNVVRPFFSAVSGWFGLLVLRSIDRIGKGIRSAPRDAMVADVTPPALRGVAFGLHRALDNAGAVGGALLAAAAIAWSSLSLREVIAWSAAPGFLGVLLLVLSVRETKPVTLTKSNAPSLSWLLLSPTLRRYLLLLAWFTFARVSETFIVLFGHDLGMSVVTLLMLWAMLNLAKSLAAWWGGTAALKLGKERVMAMSWCAYAVTFVALSLSSTPTMLWIVTLVYGLFAGLGEGIERAVIGDFASPSERGAAFGWYNMMIGVAAIPAGLVFGIIWQFAGAPQAFLFAGLVAGTSALTLQLYVAPGLKQAAVQD